MPEAELATEADVTQNRRPAFQTDPGAAEALVFNTERFGHADDLLRTG